MSVRKDEKRDRWIAVVECGERNGKRIRKQKSFTKKKDALQWEREMLSIAEQADITKYDILFSDLAEYWLSYKAKKGLEVGTMRKHKNAIRIVSNYPLYSKKARDIRMQDIEDIFDDLAKRYSKSYIKDVKCTVSSIFSYGIDQDYIIKNPCQRAAIPKNTQPGRENIGSFTKEEVKIIESYRDKVPFGDIIFIMLNTGLRTQELCAIDKDSLTVKNGVHYLIVNKALKRGRNASWIVGTPKTESSIREIPICEEVYSKILKRIIGNKYQTLLPGRGRAYTSYVTFSGEYRNFFNILNNKYNENVQYLPPHCCRHTFSSRCEWSGVAPTVTKELLGHTTIDMTQHYTHIMNDDKEAAIKKIL